MKSKQLIKNSAVNPGEKLDVQNSRPKSSHAPRDSSRRRPCMTFLTDNSVNVLEDERTHFLGTSLDLPALPILEETPQGESCNDDRDSDSETSPFEIAMTSHDSPVTTRHLSARLPEDQGDDAPMKRATKKRRTSKARRQRVIINGESKFCRCFGIVVHEIVTSRRFVTHFLESTLCDVPARNVATTRNAHDNDELHNVEWTLTNHCTVII